MWFAYCFDIISICLIITHSYILKLMWTELRQSIIIKLFIAILITLLFTMWLYVSYILVCWITNNCGEIYLDSIRQMWEQTINSLFYQFSEEDIAVDIDPKLNQDVMLHPQLTCIYIWVIDFFLRVLWR